MERELKQVCSGLVGVSAAANGLDNPIDVGRGHPKAFDNLALGLGLTKLVPAAPRHDRAAVLDEVLEGLFQRKDRRAPVGNGKVDDAKARLQIGQAEQLVLDDLGEDVLLQLDDDPHPLPVALVADLRDAFDALFLLALGDLGDEPRLVHLVGDLVE